MVGFAPGGPIDITARLLAEKLRPLLNRVVIVENKVGAGQRVALQDLRRSAPDGNTLLLATNSPFTIYPHIYAKLDYDPVKDFTPVAGIAQFDMGVATGPMTGSNNLSELVAWAKANRGRAVFGTPGAGTLPHFVGVALGGGIAVPMPPVHYKGGSPPMADLAGGHLPILVNGLSDMLEMHRSGKIRIVAVTAARRSAMLPDVPTLKESGIDVTMGVTAGVFGPAGMSPAITDNIRTALVQALAMPDVRERTARMGLTLTPMTSLEFSTLLAEESKRLQQVVKASGHVPE